MKRYPSYYLLTLVLALMTLISLLFSFLALTDIAHGGEDLAAEWMVVRVTAIIIVLFIISAIFTIHKFKRCR